MAAKLMLASVLPANPSLEQLRKQAKEFRDSVRTGHAKFTDVARRLHPRLAAATDRADAVGWDAFTLADAQLVVARWYGFASWRRLREHLDLVAHYSRSPHRQLTGRAGDLVAEFLRLACLTNVAGWGTGADGTDDMRRHAQARELLAAHPHLAAATIHTAAAVGDVTAARSLLAADASVADAEGGPYGWSPLLYAAFSRVNSSRPEHSTLEAARLLLARGADPNAGYLPDGEPPPVTALSGAFHGQRDPVNQPAHQHRLALARLLLEAGADPNDPRALANAGSYPYDDGHLSLLFRHGLGRGAGGPWRARLGHRQPTPARLVQDELLYAAERNLPGRVRLLLRHCADFGIDLDATEGGGHQQDRTAYERAMLAGNTEIADLLAAAGARVRPLGPADELIAACLRGDRPTVWRLLAAQPGLADQAINELADRARGGGPEPVYFVHQAVWLDRPEAIRLLAELGFPINDPRMSPLHTAALVGPLAVVKLLVELGGDPAAEAVDDTPGQFAPPDATPLGWARYRSQHEVAAYLAALTSTGPA